jgi:nucleoid-associated protein YgaU
MPAPFVIEEHEVPDAIRVELAGVDLPYGSEGGPAAFEMGGDLVRDRIDLPGRPRPILHILVAPDRPLSIRGAFKDWLHARAGYAREKRDQLLEIYRRANVLALSWDGDAWLGVLDKPKFGVESAGSITYELQFEILETYGVPSIPAAATPSAPTSGAMAALRATVEARRARIAAQRLRRATRQAILTALDLATNAASRVEDAIRVVEGMAGTALQRFGSGLRRVISTARIAQDLVGAARSLIRTAVAQTEVTVRTAAAIGSWWTEQAAVDIDLLSLLDGLRSVRAAARARLRASTRLYQVRPGDTLESIARQQLGDASRASELGVRSDQLTPGRLLRLPAAA